MVNILSGQIFLQVADDSSLFSFVHDINQSGINLNDDLEKISDWTFHWKMSLTLFLFANFRSQIILL